MEWDPFYDRIYHLIQKFYYGVIPKKNRL